jgi:ribosomal protein S7
MPTSHPTWRCCVTPVARIAQGRPKWGREFRTFGFPVEHGQPANGETIEEDTGGWIHFQQAKDYGHLIKPGFSGAPAFAADDNNVLGMIVAVETGDNGRVAYGEPLRRLQMAWPPMARPYKGLAQFDPADADFFFGREDIVRDLLGRLDRDPVTLIVGASGGGKSSLVFGGLLPKLDNGTWKVASFRPGREPLKSLAWAVAKVMTPRADLFGLMDRADEMRRKLDLRPDALLDAARALHAYLPTRLLLVADQFEEFFTLCHDESERANFIKAIAQFSRLQTGAPVRLVGTLRADFLGKVLDIPELGELFDGRYLMMRAMNGDELGRAIKEPARTLGVAFESGVDDLILSAVARDSAALPLMEFALERLWAEQENRWLTRAAYERMRGLEGALARHADEVLDRMTEPQKAAVRRFLCRLVNVARPGEGEDTKRPQSREELWSVAQRLSGKIDIESPQSPTRLVVLYRDEQHREVADIIHEALIRQWPRLSGWLNEERSYLLLVDELQRVRKRWEVGELPERLLRGHDLEDALENAERLLADHPELRSLIEESDEAAQRERARLRADEIWEPLEFQDGQISPHELESLARLAKADDGVRRAFLRRLYEVPDRARRFCRLPRTVVRAAVGLRRNREDLLGDNVRRGLAGGNAPEIIAATLFLLAFAGVDSAESHQALYAAGSRQSSSDELMEAIAARVSAFATHWDGVRAGRALDRVLDAIGQTEEPHPLEAFGQAVQALAPLVDADRAGRALDRVLDAIGKFTKSSRLGALGRAVQALAAHVDADRAGRALDRVLDAIGQTEEPHPLEAFGQAVQALAPLVDADRAGRAFDRVLDAIQ